MICEWCKEGAPKTLEIIGELWPGGPYRFHLCTRCSFIEFPFDGPTRDLPKSPPEEDTK